MTRLFCFASRRLAGVFGVVLALSLMCGPLVASQSSVSPEGRFLGMWVWGREWASEDSQQALIDFSIEHGIDRLLISIGPHIDDNGAVSDDVASMLARAAEVGIDIEALDSGHRIDASAQERLFRRLDAILAFNRGQPEGERFIGIHYDIEPHVTDEWRASYESRVEVMQDLLSFYAKVGARLRLEAPELLLAADVPFWLPGRTEGERSTMVEFMGQHKNLHEHIQDLTDYIGIMSYRRFAEGPNSITHHIRDELEYAEQIGRFVAASVETGEQTANPDESSIISFWGIPSDVFWDEVRTIHRVYADREGLGGVLIHSYDRFEHYLENNPPESDAR